MAGRKPYVLLAAWLLAFLRPLGPDVAPAIGAAEQRGREPPLRVAVDPRVELVSIIFRLAGNPEYGRGQVSSYARDVDQHFAPFKQHAVVEIARRLRQTRGVGFDAPMALAVHLSDAEKLQTAVPLEPWPDALDARWTPQGVREFLEAARQFAGDASFRDFFDKHRALYEAAESRMRGLLEKEGHLEWFPEFFGQRPGASFTVVLGMLNGGNCYGPHSRTADGKEDLYCVLGVWKTDAAGQPQFDAGMLGTVVHEFCHSYANAVVDRHAADLRGAGEKIFSHVAASMRSQAYGNWKTMLYESLVRACVVRYTRRYGGETAARQAASEDARRKFAWVGELSELLGDYEAHRGQYPTLEAFAPRIVRFFNDYAEKFIKEQEALNARRPKVVSMVPANGATDVDPGLRIIKVVFDRPMQDGSWSMVGGGEHFPEPDGKPAYDSKGTTWTVPVKLKPDWDYRFMLNSDRFTAFRSREGVPLAPLTVTFRTARKAIAPARPPPAAPGKRSPDASRARPVESRHAMIPCGHPGDAEHEAIFTAGGAPPGGSRRL